MRPRTSIFEPRVTLGSMAPDPLVCGRPADPELLGDVGDRPACRDASDEELAAEDGELRPTMCHESLLRVLVLNTPHLAARLSSVNNVCGNYT
jgi:hypothetical protein